MKDLKIHLGQRSCTSILIHAFVDRSEQCKYIELVSKQEGSEKLEKRLGLAQNSVQDREAVQNHTRADIFY